MIYDVSRLKDRVRRRRTNIATIKQKGLPVSLDDPIIITPLERQITVLRQKNDDQGETIRGLMRKIDELRAMSPVEMMDENKKITNFVWESRCLKAEADSEKLRTVNRELVEACTSAYLLLAQINNAEDYIIRTIHDLLSALKKAKEMGRES